MADFSRIQLQDDLEKVAKKHDLQWTEEEGMSSCTMSRKIMLMWTCIHTLVNTMEYNSSTQLFALCLFKSLTICLCFSVLNTLYQKAHIEIFYCMKNQISLRNCSGFVKSKRNGDLS